MRATQLDLFPTPDIEVRNEGSIFTFFPVTGAAEEWIAENVEEGLWLGRMLCVEPRYAWALAAEMQGDGLVLQ